MDYLQIYLLLIPSWISERNTDKQKGGEEQMWILTTSQHDCTDFFHQ